jgi:CRP-like cAMP-binding protein
VLATLRHLAIRWGRVTPNGVRIPFRLTHEVLGEIIGAQRPSVTSGLAQLEQRGLLRRAADRTFVLMGDLGDSKPES